MNIIVKIGDFHMKRDKESRFGSKLSKIRPLRLLFCLEQKLTQGKHKKRRDDQSFY